MDGQASEAVDRWVGDFLDAPRFLDHPHLLREYAPEVLGAFLRAACAHRGVGPSDLEEGDLRPGLVDGVARIEIPASVREGVPALCAAFLEEMESQGRLAGGRALGLYVVALAPAYLEAASGKAKPFVSAAPKVGRNDDCPCGSGRKYKKCCMGRLG